MKTHFSHYLLETFILDRVETDWPARYRRGFWTEVAG